MDTKELKCFVCVYEEKSINKAAGKLYITPQGLSKMIRNLESELGIELFERSNQGMIPTHNAMLFYMKAEKLLHEITCVKKEMHQLSNQKQLLRIGLANGVFHVLPIKVIQSFIEENTDIRVEWNEYANNEVKEKLKNSEIEYGFVIGKDAGGQLCQQKILSQKIELLVYEGHPLYNEECVKIDRLKEENILLMNEHFQMYHDYIAACKKRNYYPRIAAKTFEGNMLSALCRQKVGLAVIPEFISEEIRMEGMHAIPIKEMKNWEVYGTLLKDNRNFEAIKRFRSYMTEYMENLEV